MSARRRWPAPPMRSDASSTSSGAPRPRIHKKKRARDEMKYLKEKRKRKLEEITDVDADEEEDATPATPEVEPVVPSSNLIEPPMNSDLRFSSRSSSSQKTASVVASRLSCNNRHTAVAHRGAGALVVLRKYSVQPNSQPFFSNIMSVNCGGR